MFWPTDLGGIQEQASMALIVILIHAALSADTSLM